MRARTAGTVVAAVAALALAGCGSSRSGSSTAAGTSSATGSAGAGAPGAGASGSGAAAGAGTAVTVKATEFAFSLPSTHLTPGTYTFTMENDGHATHALEIEGPGLDGPRSSTAGPGGSSTVTVTLQPGTYEMYCPVGNHRSAGMQTKLTVG